MIFLVVKYHPDMPIIMERYAFQNFDNAKAKVQSLRAYLAPELYEEVKLIPMTLEDGDESPLADWEIELLYSV